jgi:hypothetical protein
MRITRNRRRPRKRKAQEGDGADWPRINLWVVLLIILLAITIPYFLKDMAGQPYRFGGSYFWFISLFISFIATLFYYSQFLLPLPWQYSWYEGFRLAVRHNFPFFVDFVRWFFIRPKITGATPEAAAHLPPGFTRHKAGIIRSHQAPVIFRGAAFIQGAGPGLLRLKQGELVVQVIDLRRQFRTLPVKVLTRDGIPLESSVSTIFQVMHMENPSDENWLFPFDQDAIFKVNYLGNFTKDDEDVMDWTERVPRQAASALIGEVSRYSLDELFHPDESTASPLEIIKEKITKRLKKAFKKNGIDITFVGVSPFNVPEDIQIERVAIWQSEWLQRIVVETGTAQAERVRRLKLARARAQIDMIEKLTDGLESIHQTGQDVTDILSLRLIEAIEEAESNAAVRALIPAQIANDLKTIRSQVLGETESS